MNAVRHGGDNKESCALGGRTLRSGYLFPIQTTQFADGLIVWSLKKLANNMPVLLLMSI